MIIKSSAWSRLSILAPLVIVTGGALAQPATRPAGGLPAIPHIPRYAATARIPDRLLDEQVGQAIVLPSEPGEYGEAPDRLSDTVLAKLTPEPRPLPEGVVIARRPGTVQRTAGGLMVHLESVPRQPDAPPMRILPNTWLAMLESVLAETGSAESDEQRRFLFTGRVTEFQGRNYLLLNNVAAVVHRPEEPSPAVAAPQPETAPEPQFQGEAETAPSDREPTAEEIIRQLMRDRPTRSLTFPEEEQERENRDQQPDEGSKEPGGAPAPEASEAPPSPAVQPLPEPPGAGDTHWQDETLLSDRLGRLLPDEDGGWMLAFENPGENPTDPPVRVLPSRLLEQALNLTAGGTRPVVLVVSGEITAHRGSNYLLLRKVLVRRRMGNLR